MFFFLSFFFFSFVYNIPLCLASETFFLSDYHMHVLLYEDKVAGKYKATNRRIVRFSVLDKRAFRLSGNKNRSEKNRDRGEKNNITEFTAPFLPTSLFTTKL